MKEVVQKYVLKNALDYGGKANAKVVLGLVLKENSGLKKDVPGLMKEIEKVASEVEKLDVNEIKKQLQKIAPELLHEKKEEVSEGLLKPLPNAKKGNVVVRIAPSPSGPLHIGHAYGVNINNEYAKMYDGKLILRIEDTNPENIYEPAYQLIENDVKWLTDNNVAEVVTQSSRLGKYYDYAEQLVQKNKVYVCTCNAEEWKELKNKGMACPCRELPLKEQQTRYAKMFNEFAEGEAVLRLKTDINHKNPAMRDFGIMRIVEHVHPKTGKKQRVWPLMVFSVAVDDHDMDVTHVLNGKDHTDNAEKERTIMEDLGWDVPEYKHWGRINFEEFVLSTSETRRAIERKEFPGWDDIRLPFLPALRRRGYQPEAFRKYALEIGLSPNDKTVSLDEFWKNINSFNKEKIDPIANRYFFIDNPIKVTIKNGKPKMVNIELHPSYPERGTRTFHTTNTFYLAESDFRQLGEGYIHRLMDWGNFEVQGEELVYVSEPYEEFKNSEHKGHIIHWLPVQGNIDVEVLMEKGVWMKGLGEEGLKNVKVGEIVQLERRYFARLDKKENNKLQFWYLHK